MLMYRDFSTSSKQKLISLVSEVENEKINDFTDWIGDRWYDFESWIGKLNIKNYVNNVNSYHKKVIDKNNATRSSIEKIFNNVASVDNSYQGQLSSLKSTLKKWDQYISQMNNIVSVKGNFTPDFIESSLNDILKKYSIDDLNSKLNLYVEIDKTTNQYIYHWNEIEELFKKNPEELIDSDYYILLFTLSTLASNNGRIKNVDNLEQFINAEYTTPANVTPNDYHESFETLKNGQKMSYYYIQNKSYMSDTLKKISALYSSSCDVSGQNNDLNSLLKSIVENYSVIEWRQKLDYVDSFAFVNMKRDTCCGELTISEKTLNGFNSICVPKISVDFVNNVSDGSGLDYYLITSNASNAGNVITTTARDGFVFLNVGEKDDYSDCTLRVYIDCENQNSNVVATVLNGRSILSQYYEAFDWESVLTDAGVDIVAEYAPFGGKLISSLYDIASQAETLEILSSSVKGATSINLADNSKVTEKTEKKIDAGLNEVSRGIGIITKYMATEKNNKKVEENQDSMSDFSNSLMQKTNLGLQYDTMVVKFDHFSYTDGGQEIKVDDKKDCDKATCIISPQNYQYNSELLRSQYDYIMHKKISDADFEELEKQIQEYIKTEKVDEGSLLANYICEWKGD